MSISLTSRNKSIIEISFGITFLSHSSTSFVASFDREVLCRIYSLSLVVFVASYSLIIVSPLFLVFIVKFSWKCEETVFYLMENYWDLSDPA